MFSYLTVAPYWLVPPLLTFFCWKYKQFKMWGNLPIMMIVLLSYSFFLKDADEYLYPTEPLMNEMTPSCGMPYLAFFIIKFFFLFPASLLFQIFLNYMFLYKTKQERKKIKEVSESNTLF